MPALGEKWTSTLFLGVACTYVGSEDCSTSQNLYPVAGAGVQYVLKPKEGVVLNLEYAQGKDANTGVGSSVSGGTERSTFGQFDWVGGGLLQDF